jgi:hypothetical protein
MTKKDYELIAQAVCDVWCNAQAQQLIAESLAAALATDNPRFNRELFLSACGVN